MPKQLTAKETYAQAVIALERLRVKYPASVCGYEPKNHVARNARSRSLQRRRGEVSDLVARLKKRAEYLNVGGINMASDLMLIAAARLTELEQKIEHIHAIARDCPPYGERPAINAIAAFTKGDDHG